MVQEDPVEEGIATHPIILTWRIQRTEEPAGLQSTGSQRVRHVWNDLAHTHTIASSFYIMELGSLIDAGDWEAIKETKTLGKTEIR